MKGVVPGGTSGMPVPGMVWESGTASAAKEDLVVTICGSPESPPHSPPKAFADNHLWYNDSNSSTHSSPVKDWMVGWGLQAVTEPVFLDAEAMKEKVRQALHKPPYNVANFYKETGLWQQIARSSRFENIALFVISLNALWIAVDTEFNHAKVLNAAPPIFQLAEHFFCAFFFSEWMVRFMAFKVKSDGFKDSWFVFDGMMMLMMVLETWVMSFYIYVTGEELLSSGNSSALRLLRVLRLSRVARVAKILRALPDLMILLKGLLAAVRSVFFTFCLLMLLIYIFGIAIKQLSADTKMGQKYFSGVIQSMYTLFVRGALLDEIAELLGDVLEESVLVGGILILFILAASVTVMNMLIGVLCQVVTTVADVEREEMAVGGLKCKLGAVAESLDHDGDGTISKDEFGSLISDAAACKALQQVGVDAVGLIDYADIIFESEEGIDKSLTFADFIEIVLDLRGSCQATVKDVVDLRKYTRNSLRRLTNQMELCTNRLARIDENLNRLMVGGTPVNKSESCPPGIMMQDGKSAVLRRSRSTSSFGISTHEDDAKRPSGHARVPSKERLSTSVAEHPTSKMQRSISVDTGSTASADVTKLMERVNKSLDARFAELHQMLRDSMQDMQSGAPASSTCPGSSPCSPTGKGLSRGPTATNTSVKPVKGEPQSLTDPFGGLHF